MSAHDKQAQDTASLADRIADFQAELLPSIPAEVLSAIQAGGEQIAGLGIEQRGLRTGAAIPDFTLPNAAGEQVSAGQLLGGGPLVLSFYRGAWCPYCSLEIRALAESLGAMRARGAELVAVSPQLPDISRQQVSDLQLDFEVLSDAGNAVARQFGLVFTLPEILRPVYAAWGIDLPASNGDDSFELPVPATYIVDRDGLIRYHFIDSDYTRRCEPALVLEQLDLLHP